MKKKVSLFLLCGIILLGVCGCDKEKNKVSNSENVNTPLYNTCSLTADSVEYFGKDFYCPEMREIKHGGFSFFITNDGQLYEYSNKKYSTTENNCKKVETDVIFDKIIKGTLVSKNGNFYSYHDGNLKKISDDEIEKGRAWYGLDQMEIKVYKANNKIFYLDQLDMNDPEIYGYVDGNSIYSISYDWDSNKTNEKLLYTFKNDEVIEKLTNGYIITTKGYYVYDIINKNECQRYEDIDCEYGLVKVETKSDCEDSIIYVDDMLLVNQNMVKQ